MAKYIDAVLRLHDQFSATMQKASDQISSFSRQNLRLGGQITRTGRSLEKFGSTVTRSVTLPVVALGTAAVKTFIDIEDAFSGIQKTVSGTPEQLQALKAELDELASTTLPVARTELYGIAETAGQLGVATEYITRYTETVAKIGRVTNLTYNEGSAAMARFANIMNMPMENIDRLGSTVVELDNSLATSAKEIVEMALRLAAAGKQADMAEAEVLGLAGALSSVGLEAQAGGSAFSKVILSMTSAVHANNSQLQKFADVAGMSRSEFAKLFSEDSASAIIAFIKGLSRLKSEGYNVAGIIDALGFSEIRTRDALLRVTEASDLFAESIETGSKAWEENIALNEVFTKRTDNTRAKIDLMLNKLSRTGTSLASTIMPYVIQGIDKVNALIDRFNALDEVQKESIVKWAIRAAVFGPVINVLGKIATVIGGTITSIGRFGKAVRALRGSAASLAKLSSTAQRTKSISALFKAILTPGVKVALVIGAIAAAVYLLIKYWKPISGFLRSVGASLKEFFGITDEHIQMFRNGIQTFANIIKITFGVVRAVFMAIVPVVKTAFAISVGVVVGAAQLIARAIGLIIKGLINFGLLVQPVFEGIGKIVKGIVNGIISILNTLIRAMNKLHWKIPDWVPVMGGQEFGFNIPEIPMLAKGAHFFRGGLAIVGERGPELINLPRGSQVIPTDKTRDVLSATRSTTVYTTNQQPVIVNLNVDRLADVIHASDPADVDRMVTKVAKKIEELFVEAFGNSGYVLVPAR